MGFFSRATAPEPQTPQIKAQYEPQLLGERYNAISSGLYTLNRDLAMSVPTVARCRNLITGVIAATPLELYKKSTGEELGKPLWLEQPSLHQPRSITLAWTIDSLIFYGQSFWRITERYSDDGRPARFEWVANVRVTYDLDILNQYVTQYYIDGVPIGMNDIVTFQAFDEGILTRGSSTIKAAIDLQKASNIAAATPMPTGWIRNSGADLPEKEVQGLLASWNKARNNRSTAYLTSTLEYQIAQFSPKEMMYSEASQFLSTEISRLMNVPAIYVSADQNSSYTYTNVLDSRKDFVAYSLQPFVSAIQDRLSMDDITARGNEVRFCLADTFLKNDPMEELMVIEKLLALGLITTEQAMEMTDLTPNGSGEME